MPTGYTAGILDGTITTFPQFAKQCMRAFGATLHMRDDSMDAEYTPRVPTDYHLKAIEKSKKAINDVWKMTDEEIVSTTKRQLEENKAYYLKQIEKMKVETVKINEILSGVKNWTPPTSEHLEIKNFMINQIEMTIKSDLDVEYYEKQLQKIENEILLLDANKIIIEILETENRNLAYHTEKNIEELKMCENSNKWVREFLESIKTN